MTSTDTPWEPPLAGTETEQVVGALDRLRATFRWKADGLDSAGLELDLRTTTEGPTEAFRILERHDITVRSTDAEIDQERAVYKLQVRVHPSADVHAALAALSNLPEVRRVSLTGLRDYE